MKKPLNKYPKGWNEKKVKALIKHYEEQTEDEEVAEDEAAFNDPQQTVMLVPRELVPKITKLLSAHGARKNNSAGTRAGTTHRAARRRANRDAHAA